MALKIGNLIIDPPVMLAPLAGITSWPMRLICRSFGAPLCFTEMISAPAIARRRPQAEALNALKSHPADRPLGFQLYGAVPEEVAEAASLLSAFDADLIDLNMGCPVKKVVKSGAGSDLMRDLPRAQKMIKLARERVKTPLTVKMRLGWDDQSRNAVELAKICEGEGVDAVTVHARTRARGFAGPPDLEALRQVVEAVKIPVIGNGGVLSVLDAWEMIRATGCAGVMVARGARGTPWIFAAIKEGPESARANPTMAERARVIHQHFQWTLDSLPERKAVVDFRKHLSWYSKGISRAVELRRELQPIATAGQARDLIERYFAE